MTTAAGGDFSMAEHRTVGILYFLAGCIGIVSNAIVISIFRGQKVLGGSRSKLHIHFAFLNILIVAGIPLSGSSAFAGKWLFGTVGCQIYGCLTYTGGMGAVTFAGLLCYQRYFCTSSPNTYDISGWPSVLACVGWIYSLSVAVGPLVGWNSFVIESAGTACGLNYMEDDYSHRSMFIVITAVSLVQLVLSLLALRAAFSTPVAELRAASSTPVAELRAASSTPVAEKTEETDWFTNNQLNWIAFWNLVIVTIGFTPYGYFAVWALFNHASQMTMLGSVIPPLFAKLSTCFYPIVYMAASKKFRDAFAEKLFGTCVEKKEN